MGCEGVFVLFIIYYTIEECLEIAKHKLKYFKSFWNILDVLVIALGYICILFNLYRSIVVDKLLTSILEDPSQYANFDSLGFWQTQFNNIVAVAVFFAWIKVCCSSDILKGVLVGYINELRFGGNRKECQIYVVRLDISITHVEYC